MDAVIKILLLDALKAWAQASARIPALSQASMNALAEVNRELKEVERCRDLIFDCLNRAGSGGAEAYFMVDKHLFRVIATRVTDCLPARVQEIAYSVLSPDDMAPILDTLKENLTASPVVGGATMVNDSE